MGCGACGAFSYDPAEKDEQLNDADPVVRAKACEEMVARVIMRGDGCSPQKRAQICDKYMEHHSQQLYGLLQDPDEKVKVAALKCISQILDELSELNRQPFRQKTKEKRSDHLPLLREHAKVIASFCDHSEPSVVKCAIRLLRRLGKDAAYYNANFLSCLSHKDEGVQKAAKGAVADLERLGKSDPEVQKIIESAKAGKAEEAVKNLQGDVAKRKDGCQVLGNLGADVVQKFQKELAELLGDDDEEVRGKACEVLGMLGTAAEPYAESFLGVFSNTSQSLKVRCQALHAIGSIGPTAASETVLAEMKNAFLVGDIEVAAHVGPVLKALGPDAVAIAAEGLEAFPEQPRKLLCLKALVGAGKQYGKAIENHFLKDDTPNDQKLICLEALAKIGGEHGKAIETHLEKPGTPSEQKLACVKALGEIGRPYGKSIGNYLLKGDTPTDHKIQCLKELGGAELVRETDNCAIIAKCLSDKNEDVVQAALSALEGAGHERKRYENELKECYKADPKKREKAYKVLKDAGIDMYDDPKMKPILWEGIFGKSVKGVIMKEGNSIDHPDTLFVDSSGSLRLKYNGDVLLSIDGTRVEWKNNKGKWPNGDNHWLWESDYLKPKTQDDQDKWKYKKSGDQLKNEGSAGGDSWRKYSGGWTNGSTKWILDGDVPDQYAVMVCIGFLK